MQNSNLLKLLSTFSVGEMKSFRDFIASPFFNTNKSVIKIFDHIRKHHPKYNDFKLSKETVYSKVFGSGKYNDGFMRSIMFLLYKLAEEFIAYNSFCAKKYEKKLSFLEYCSKRKLNKSFEKTFGEINSLLDNSKVRDEEFYQARIRTQFQMELFNELNRYKRKDYKILKEYSFKSIGENVVLNYFLSALTNYSFLFDKIDESNKSVHAKFLNLTIEYLVEHMSDFSGSPLIELNLLELLLYKTEDEKHYYRLKDILNNDHRSLTHSDRYNLHNVLQHYCVIRLFKGKAAFRNERLELFKIALAQKLYSYFEDDHFNDLLFGNIVLVSISLSEYDWAEQFIKQYEDLISPEIRQTIVNYTLSRLSFAKGEFEKTLYHINKVGNEADISYRTAVRELALMTFYELDLLTELSSQIDAYKHFIVKNKKNLTEQNYIRTNNFVIYITRLYKIREKFNRKDFDELKKEVGENTNILERTWLMKKINELV